MPTVGVLANPASGRDIRRLVTGASVFDNAEKGSMVFRLMAGLGAAGVERVLMMPAADGVGSALDGEREIERTEHDRVTVELTPGPYRVDVDAVMRQAAEAGVLATRVQRSES